MRRCEILIHDYWLMHKDIQAAVFSFDDTNNSIRAIKENPQNTVYIPLGYQGKLLQWIQDRAIPDTRQGIKKDLSNISRLKLLMDNLGLSLTDSYWFKPIDTNLCWNEVNLYQNRFQDTMTLDMNPKPLIADGTVVRTQYTNFTPSASLKGDLKKKWLIDENGIRFLAKGNYADSCVQSLSEVLASEIYRRQPRKIEYIPYNLIDIPSDGTIVKGCYCPNFTNEDLEFVSAYEIVSSQKKRNDMNYFQFYKFILESHGIYASDFYDCQIMVDFIITNVDRHFNNFGVLRNSNTLQFVKPAPIFDNGNSMFYNCEEIPLGPRLLDIEVHSFRKREVDLLRSVTNRGLIDIKHLPTDNEVFELFGIDPYLSDEKRERIVKAYIRKIKFLEDFQNGVKIWNYNYAKNKR